MALTTPPGNPPKDVTIQRFKILAIFQSLAIFCSPILSQKLLQDARNALLSNLQEPTTARSVINVYFAWIM